MCNPPLKILNLNPSLDRWLILNDTQLEKYIFRAKESLTFISGKGLNVARTLSTIGFNNYMCINIIGNDIGTIIEKYISNDALNCNSFYISGQNRINTIIIDNQNQMQIFNELGPGMKESEINDFMLYLKYILNPGDQVVISGSSPRSLRINFFQILLATIKALGCKIKVDISGNYLDIALKYEADFIDLIKLNYFEFQDYFDINPRNKKKVISRMKQMKLQRIIITLGKDGAIYYYKDKCYHGYYTKVFGGYAIGSGDSFFAGWLSQDYALDNWEEKLKWALACGAANLISSKLGPSVLSSSDVKEIYNFINIKEI